LGLELPLLRRCCTYIGCVFWALVAQEVVKTIVPHSVYLEQAEKLYERNVVQILRI